MNDHLSDGRLRSGLDGELTPREMRHLESCAACTARRRALEAEIAPTARRLAFLAPSTQDPVPETHAALEELHERKRTQKENDMLRRMFASPILRFGAALVLIVVLVVSIPSARAIASRLLDLFRVQQVTVVPVDFTGLDQLTNANGNQISSLISDSIDMKKKPGSPVDAADAADAAGKGGFAVRLPADLTPSHLSVLGGSAFDVTVDRTKAQALLDEAGRGDLVLPESIDGAVISVNVPASVRADYGTCPDPSGSDADGEGIPGRRFPDCVILSQIPSPTVTAPDEIDVAQLAQIGLEFTGMTREQAAAFTDSVDWTSTLVVPIPKNAATYEQVSVDGVTGTLIQRPADDSPQFLLLWVRDGIVYAIGGLGTNSDKAVDMANSLQ